MFDILKEISSSRKKLIKTNHTITGSNNVNLRKVNVNPDMVHKIDKDKFLIEDELYQIDKFKKQ